MATQEPSIPDTRQGRRKAATRDKIQTAAEQLFAERGYAATSIEDISEVADVAVRTIYMHFPSKAAVMLAYFDDWVSAFIEEVLRRPVGEPVVDTVREALQAMNVAGWVDRVENKDGRVHPLAEHLDSGSPDIAGHILQRWMHEMDRLTDDATTRGDYPKGSLEPRARAVAVFASWISAMSAARSQPQDNNSNRLRRSKHDSPGLEILSLITSGSL